MKNVFARIINGVYLFALVLVSTSMALGDDTLPVLGIHRSHTPGSIELSWEPGSGFSQLEHSFDLSTNDWQAVEEAPTYQAPLLRLELPITSDPGVGFYRLRAVAEPGPVIVYDPATQAPPLPKSVVPDFFSKTAFLYTGSTASQIGVAPGTINPTTAAVIRGLVKQKNGQPLGGVRIAIQGRPEFGWTYTRADGYYDIALNGGTLEQVDYRLAGYLPAQRQVQVPQQDFVRVEDVVMSTFDTVATTVSFGPNVPVQVAGSSVRTDAAGSRSATLFFPAGVGAQILHRDGTTEPVGSLTIRATEYTVGSNGQASMPAQLPGTSEYTYCVGFSADGVVNAKSVVFDHTVAAYVDNFLGFPVGAVVPSGFYDPEKSAWVPSDNGFTMKVVSINNGIANLDVDGDGNAETDQDLDSIGIVSAERQQIAARFSAGQTFWRMPISHFTDASQRRQEKTVPAGSLASREASGRSLLPQAVSAGGGAPASPLTGAWDFNYPKIDVPPGPPTTTQTPVKPANDYEGQFGELMLATQVFKEKLPVAGTDLSLHYSSDRVPGYRVSATLELPLIQGNPFGNLDGVDLEITVAGQTFSRSFNPENNLTYIFSWDGRDAYRPAENSSAPPVAGSGVANVTIAYIYPTFYNFASIYDYFADPRPLAERLASVIPTFGLPPEAISSTAIAHNGSGTGVFTRFDQTLVVPDERRVGLGGWSLTPHHFYDPVAKILYRGDGEQVKADLRGQNLSVFYVSNNLFRFRTLAAKANGEVYLQLLGTGFEGNFNQIVKIRPDRVVVPVTAAPGTASEISPTSQALDGKLASNVVIVGPRPTVNEMRVGPDDSIYLAFDTSIWRLDKDDRFHIVLCGSGDENIPAPEGGYANNSYRNASSGERSHIAVGKDGSVFYNEGQPNPNDSSRPLNLIRKIAPDGRVYTIAGLGGQPAGFGDSQEDDSYLGQPAKTARLYPVLSLAVGPDDSVYYAGGSSSVVRIKPDGILERTVNRSLRNPAGYPNCDGCPPYPTDDGAAGVTAGVTRTQRISSLQVATDGTLYFFEQPSNSLPTIWKLDTAGILHVVAGRWFAPMTSGNPLQVGVGELWDLALLSDNNLFIAAPSDGGAATSVKQIAAPLPGFSAGELRVASDDGTEIYVFDENGKHLRTIDSFLNVNKWVFGYDSNGFLSSMTDRDGLITRIEHDGSGRPTAIVGPFGARTVLESDANGYLASLTAPDQTKVQMTNSTLGLLQVLTGQRQENYAMTYDDLGRLIKADHPNGGFTELQGTGFQRDRSVTRTTAGGKVETRQQVLTSQNGTTITRTKQDENQPTIETRQADGSIGLGGLGITAETQFQPDPRGPLASQADYVSSAIYRTNSGATFKATTTEQATLTNINDPFSLLAFSISTNQNGNTRRTDFDRATRSAVTLSAEGRVLERRLDPVGRLSFAKAGDLEASNFAFNQLGQLINASQGGGNNARLTSFEYDASGYVNLIRDGDLREVQLVNDVVGRPTSIVLPGDRTVTLLYGPDGRPESITPPDRSAYSYGYDIPNRKITFRVPSLPGVEDTTVYEQTLDRQFKSLTLPGNRRLEVTRRPSGRIAGMTDTFGDSFTYSYNGAGRLNKIEQANGQTLDLIGAGPEVTNVTWSGAVGGAIARVYTGDLLYYSEKVNAETPILFGYDRDTLMTTAGALTIDWRSDAPLPTSAGIGNVTASFTYDEFGDLERLVTSYDNAPLLDIQTTYSKTTTITDQLISINGGVAVSNHYDYDAAGFLSSVKKNNVVVATFLYDKNGNLTNETGPSGDITYTYDARDRLLSTSDRSFTYTDADELKTKVGPEGTTTYTYDESGQLRRVVLPDGRLIEYSVGAPGARIAKSINGTRVQGFLLDEGGVVLAELDGNNAVINRFVYADISQTPAYMVRGGETFRFVTDALDSVRLVVNTQTGAIAQRIDYDEWGKVTLDTNPGFQPFGYAGGIYDPDTGLVRFGARDYDASVRRWTASDPVKFGGGSTNLYAYVDNNPLKYIDPRGTGPRGLKILRTSPYSDGVNVWYPSHHRLEPEEKAEEKEKEPLGNLKERYSPKEIGTEFLTHVAAEHAGLPTAPLFAITVAGVGSDAAYVGIEHTFGNPISNSYNNLQQIKGIENALRKH